MTIQNDSNYPYPKNLPSIQFELEDFLSASPAQFKGYGRYINDTNNPPEIEQIPYVDPDSRSWRLPDPNTGINRATISGDFNAYYNPHNKSVEALNLAVKSKQLENAFYTIAWDDERVADSETAYVRVVEFNNHKDAGQQFLLKKGDGALFLLGRTPIGTNPKDLSSWLVHADNIDPLIDMVLFYLPKDEAIEVAPGVYHQPLYPIDKQNEVVAKSIQGSIHNCTSCYFVNEMGADVSFPLGKPTLLTKADYNKQTILNKLLRAQKNYHLFVLRTGIHIGEKAEESLLKRRDALYRSLNYHIETIKLWFAAPLTYDSQNKEGLNNSLTMVQIQKICRYYESQMNKASTDDDVLLLTLIKERINWLTTVGRFLYHEDNGYFYHGDSLPLSTLLLNLGLNAGVISNKHDIYQQLFEHIRYCVLTFEPTLSPYQRIIEQQKVLLQQTDDSLIT